MTRSGARRRLQAIVTALVAVGAVLALPAVQADEPAPSAPAQADALTELLIKFQVTGTFKRFDPAANLVTFSFAGPFYASAVGHDGLVSDSPGRRLGEVTGATVEFTPGWNSDTFRFTCDDCEFRFDDGSVLKPLLYDPATPWHRTNIPMEGRMLVELGPVPTPDPAMIALRGAGCGGTHETAGRGRLSGQHGTVCVNGVFAFPAFLRSLSPAALRDNRDRLADVTGTGESDCTLVFHSPPLPAG